MTHLIPRCGDPEPESIDAHVQIDPGAEVILEDATRESIEAAIEYLRELLQ